jgi:hypothetical protein
VVPRISAGCNRRGERFALLQLEFKTAAGRAPTPDVAQRFLDEVRGFWDIFRKRTGLPRSAFAVLQIADLEQSEIKIRAFYVGPDLGAEWSALWLEAAPAGADMVVRAVRSFDLGLQALVCLPNRTPAQAAVAEAAFDGVRRIRAIGALYGEPDAEAQTSKPEGCPYDASELMPILGVLPIERIEREGYRELTAARRDAQARAAPLSTAA